MSWLAPGTAESELDRAWVSVLRDEDAEPANSDSLPTLQELQLPAARATVEAVLGLLAAFFIGFIAPLAAFAIAMAQQWGIAIGLLAVGTTGWLAILVARLASAALEGDHPRSFALSSQPPSSRLRPPRLYVPLALAMAIRVPRFLLPFNLLVGLWWLIHFVAAAGLGHLAALQVTQRFQAGQWLLAIPCSLAVHFAFLFAANLYLVLSLAATSRSPTPWLFVWRYRFVIDLSLALALVFWR